MPHVKNQIAVQADIQTLWRVLLDKIEHPERYLAFAKKVEFLEDTNTHIIRQLGSDDMMLTEKITLDETMGQVKYELLEHPLFTGTVTESILPPAHTNAPTLLSMEINWQPANEEARQIEHAAEAGMQENMTLALQHIKAIAEQWAKAPVS